MIDELGKRRTVDHDWTTLVLFPGWTGQSIFYLLEDKETPENKHLTANREFHEVKDMVEEGAACDDDDAFKKVEGIPNDKVVEEPMSEDEVEESTCCLRTDPSRRFWRGGYRLWKRSGRCRNASSA